MDSPASQASDTAINIFFDRNGPRLSKTIGIGSAPASSSVDLSDIPGCEGETDLGAWWKAYLRGARPENTELSGEVNVVELFCGPGGLAQGVKQFCAESEIGRASCRERV